MAIDSSSTQAQIVAQYLDNLGYDHSGSVSAAKLFIEACRALLVMHPDKWEGEDTNFEFDKSLWTKELEKAQDWLNANSTASGTGSVRHLAFGVGFR